MTVSTLPAICLVRHGETARTTSGWHTGRTDVALTEHGERAARELGIGLQGSSVVTVLTGPLQLARQTTELTGS